ncbi:MAG: site-specific integrase [Candidatus Micrarchaeota archaeon]
MTSLSKGISEERKKRYPRRNTLFGNVDRAFTENELRAFFHQIKDYRSRVCFGLQAYAGLRLGEAIAVRLEDIDWENREIKILTEKTGLIDFVPVSQPLFDLLEHYCKAFKGKIEKSGGWLIYSKWGKGNAGADSLRNIFRKACTRAKLNRVYGMDLKRHQLHVLTSHSLRYYFASKLHSEGVSELTISRLLRHTNLSSTSQYIVKTRGQLHSAVKQAFEISPSQRRGGETK